MVEHEPKIFMIGAPQKYIWTSHSRAKMRHYHLTESRIKRIIRHPVRTEEGILEGAIAVMQPADNSWRGSPEGRPAEGKRYSEIWVMYIVVQNQVFSGRLSSAPRADFSFGTQPRSSRFARSRARSAESGPKKLSFSHEGFEKGIKVITAWRYPGKSPERDPIPAEILKEIRNVIWL